MVGFRYRKSINLGGGVRLNLSKKGIGVSAGVKGLRYTLGADGRRRVTASIPGTGISYVKESSGKRKTTQQRRASMTTPSQLAHSPVLTLFDVYTRGIPEDGPVLPKWRLFGNNSERKRLKPLIDRLHHAVEVTRSMKLDTATGLLSMLTLDFPNSKYIKFVHAIALALNNQLKPAHQIFKTLPMCPNDDLKLLRARCAIAAEEPKAALSIFDAISSDALIDDEVTILRAVCMRGLDEYNAALEILKSFNPRKSSNQNENATRYHYLKGYCYEQLNKPKQAIASYERALAYPVVEGMDLEQRLETLRTSKPSNRRE